MNGIGYESGNEGFTDGRDLPWLQDVQGVDVWTSWGIAYRDVLILDEDNRVVDVVNLTANDLKEPANYQALKDLLAP